MDKLCTDKLIEQIRPLRERNIAWSVIAKAVAVGQSTLKFWRTPESERFVPKFAVMVKEAAEAFDSGRIKAGQTEQAVKHKLKKVTKERRTTRCPEMPPSYFKKPEIIVYADEELDLILDPKTTISEMYYEMRLRIRELIEYGEPYYVVEDVVVKIEETEVDPSQAAVKNVLTNTGKASERWGFKEVHDFENVQFRLMLGEPKK